MYTDDSIIVAFSDARPFYEELLQKIKVGDVIKFTDIDFETFCVRVDQYKKEEEQFNFIFNNPGTPAYLSFKTSATCSYVNRVS